jgi:SHS2 domain-containing protein
MPSIRRVLTGAAVGGTIGVMSEPHFELYDHTADLGVRAYAPTVAGLAWPAVQGLYAAIGTLAPAGAEEPLELELRGDDPALLLRDLLARVLLLFESGRMLTAIESCEIIAGAMRVHARAAGIDEDRSDLEREVKAVTYHELAVRDAPGGYELNFIVDI